MPTDTDGQADKMTFFVLLRLYRGLYFHSQFPKFFLNSTLDSFPMEV